MKQKLTKLTARAIFTVYHLYHLALCRFGLHEYKTATGNKWPEGKTLTKTYCPHCDWQGNWHE